MTRPAIGTAVSAGIKPHQHHRKLRGCFSRQMPADKTRGWALAGMLPTVFLPPAPPRPHRHILHAQLLGKASSTRRGIPHQATRPAVAPTPHHQRMSHPGHISCRREIPRAVDMHGPIARLQHGPCLHARHIAENNHPPHPGRQQQTVCTHRRHGGYTASQHLRQCSAALGT